LLLRENSSQKRTGVTFVVKGTQLYLSVMSQTRLFADGKINNISPLALSNSWYSSTDLLKVDTWQRWTYVLQTYSNLHGRAGDPV